MEATDKKRNPTREATLRVLRKVAVDGILGAVCGGLYGLIYGGFAAHLHGDVWKLVSIALHFAGWGITAGTLVGAYAGLFASDGETIGSRDSSQDVTAKHEASAGAPRHYATSSHHAPQHHLASPSRTDRKQTQTVGA